MTGSHERFDELAVSHVLGGLSAAQASVFRSHLLDCVHCRARVSELRGLADDLEMAAREERHAQRLRVETPPLVRADAPPPMIEIDRRRRWLFVAAASGMAILVVLVVWTQALQWREGASAAAGSAGDRVLAALADGQALEVTTRADVTGVAAHDPGADAVAISVGNLSNLAASNQVVVWRLDGDVWTTVVELAPGQLVGERLAMVVETTATTKEVIVTVEMTVMPDVPNDNPVFRVTMP